MGGMATSQNSSPGGGGAVINNNDSKRDNPFLQFVANARYSPQLYNYYYAASVK
jgi:hypothetical protein